jgi:Arc/MetJ-type ribon-helix-helix transcriptional regulator
LILKKARKPAPKSSSMIISFHIPPTVLDAIDKLVEAGIFHTRSEAIRLAVFEMLAKYRFLWDDKDKAQVGYR